MKPSSLQGPISARTDAPRRSGAAIDFTMMYLTHNAFRRDLGLLARQVRSQRVVYELSVSDGSRINQS